MGGHTHQAHTVFNDRENGHGTKTTKLSLKHLFRVCLLMQSIYWLSCFNTHICSVNYSFFLNFVVFVHGGEYWVMSMWSL